MIQSIPRKNFGGQLGEVLGAGIQDLAAYKLAEITKKYDTKKERSDFSKNWEPLLGRNTATRLSHFSPEERKLIFQSPKFLIELSKESPKEQVGMGALAGYQQRPEQEQEQYNPQHELQSALQQYFNNPTLGGGQQMQSLLQPQPQQQFGYPQQEVGQQGNQGQGQLSPEQAELISQLFETPQQRLARQKERLAIQKEERENKKLALSERRENIKKTKKYVDELKAKEKAVKEADLRLGRMEKLIDKGNLPNAALWSALSKFENAPFISGLTAPFAELLKGGVKWYSGEPSDIEEFEKLSSEFVKNAKQYFGSRITQKEVEMFMHTVPTLMQTDAGKKKLINNIRSLNELTEIEAKAARSIIKENGGIPPIDIEQQVQDKIGKKVDRVAKMFTTR